MACGEILAKKKIGLEHLKEFTDDFIENVTHSTSRAHLYIVRYIMSRSTSL